MALAHGHEPGGKTKTVIERQPQGFIPWIRRRVVFLSDPEPIEERHTAKSDELSMRDLELLAAHAAGSGQTWGGM